MFSVDAGDRGGHIYLVVHEPQAVRVGLRLDQDRVAELAMAESFTEDGVPVGALLWGLLPPSACYATIVVGGVPIPTCAVLSRVVFAEVPGGFGDGSVTALAFDDAGGEVGRLQVPAGR